MNLWLRSHGQSKQGSLKVRIFVVYFMCKNAHSPVFNKYLNLFLVKIFVTFDEFYFIWFKNNMLYIISLFRRFVLFCFVFVFVFLFCFVLFCFVFFFRKGAIKMHIYYNYLFKIVKIAHFYVCLSPCYI